MTAETIQASVNRDAMIEVVVAALTHRWASHKEIAKRTGCHETTVYECHRVLKAGNPDDIRAVLRGDKSSYTVLWQTPAES